MLPGLLGAKKNVVGIDVGSSSIKLVQLKEVKGRYRLLNLGVAQLPPEAIVDNTVMDSVAVVDRIRNLVENQKIKTKNVATSVSGHSVIIRKITMPVMTEEEVQNSIEWEAEQFIPFEISEVNLDFQIIGPDPNDSAQMTVLLVAAKKDFVNEGLSIFNECGLNPVVLDIDCFALQNAFEANYGIEEEKIIALVDIGASEMNVNVLKGGSSVFTRDIQVGGNMFSEEIQKRLGLNSEEAEQVKLGADVEGVDRTAVTEVMSESAESLAQEIQRSLDYFSATSSDDKVDRIYISGGVSRTPGMVDVLEQRIGVPVELLDPFREIEIDEEILDRDYVQAVAPLFAVGVGLAMRRFGDK
ncbi:MAG: type IV pilus assembly protein PilM [Syntrophotaleaceae bacterium]